MRDQFVFFFQIVSDFIFPPFHHFPLLSPVTLSPTPWPSLVDLSQSHTLCYTCGSGTTPVCCAAAPLHSHKLLPRPRGKHLPNNCLGRFAYGRRSNAHTPACSSVCVCGWRGTKRATTRQVGFHQWTGSCDCGRFVMGCVCVCVWSQFAHGGKKKMCRVCLSEFIPVSLCAFAQVWLWLQLLTNRGRSR